MSNVLSLRIYDFKESVKESGLPMNTKYYNLKTDGRKDTIKCLASAKSGSGHDTFLKGIQVRMVIEGTRNFWLQWMRYHHQDMLTDIVSSQSLMHKITSFDIKEKCSEEVSPYIIEELERLIALYKEAEKGVTMFGKYPEPIKLGWTEVKYSDSFKRIILSNVPCGVKLTASIATNFLQLKTIVAQRDTHLLREWRDIITAITSTDEWKELFGE